MPTTDRQIYQLPNAALSPELLIPVQPMGGGTTSHITFAQLMERFGHVVIPRLNLSVRKANLVAGHPFSDPAAVVYDSPQLATSWSPVLSERWRELEPQIWAFRYRRSATWTDTDGLSERQGRFVHPADPSRYNVNPETYCPQFFSGAGNYQKFIAPGELEKTTIFRPSEFPCPEEPFKFQTLDGFTALDWFSHSEEQRLATIADLPFVWKWPDTESGVPLRLLPTGHGRSRRSTKAFAQYFYFAIVVKAPSPFEPSGFGWIVGPPSQIVKLSPRLERPIGMEQTMCRGVKIELRSTLY